MGSGLGPLRSHPPPAHREASCLWALRISNFGGCSRSYFPCSLCEKETKIAKYIWTKQRPSPKTRSRLPVTFTEYQAQLRPDGTCFPPETGGPFQGKRREGPRRQGACAAASVLGGVGGALSMHAGARRRREPGSRLRAGGSTFWRTTRGGSPPAPTPPLHSPEPTTLHRSARPWERGSCGRGRGRRLPAWASASLPDTHARRQPEGRITDLSTS